MVKKYLIVKGCAGLGNRLLTVCAAIEYARRTNRILVIDWTDGLYGVPGKNIFSKYFSLKDISYIEINEEKDLNALGNGTVYPSAFKDKLNYKLYDLYKQIAHPFFRKIPENRFSFLGMNRIKSAWVLKSGITKDGKLHLGEYLKTVLSKDSFPLGDNLHYNIDKNIVIYAEYVPFFYENNLSYLQLKAEMKQVIEHFSDEKGLNMTVGIHIRNTDMKPTKAIELLIEEIKKRHFSSKIFLSTDDPNLTTLFREHFKDVICYEKYIPSVGINEGVHQWAQRNNNYEAAEIILKDSIMDMYLLSKCEYLYYQGNSSFSTIAKALHSEKNKCINWLN